MALIVSDPTRYFVFEFPKNFSPFEEEPYRTEYSNPYLKPDPFGSVFEISIFHLPYDFHSEPIYTEDVEHFAGQEIPDNYIFEYEHTLVEMTEQDVKKAFLKRAFEYYGYDLNEEDSLGEWYIYRFLDYHYSLYHYDLDNWLDYVLQVFKDSSKYIKKPQLTELKLRNKVNEWIVERRIELSRLNGESIEQQTPTVEVFEETIELDTELEKTAHKVVLLHELRVIEHLQKLCKEKNPTMSHTKFAELIGFILGLQGKKIEAVRKGLSGYGQKTRDDPKTKDALKKVKSELLKFGIEL